MRELQEARGKPESDVPRRRLQSPQGEAQRSRGGDSAQRAGLGTQSPASSLASCPGASPALQPPTAPPAGPAPVLRGLACVSPFFT